MGPIIWTCLMLTMHQAPAQQFYINSRSVSLPIKLTEKGRNETQELILLVSADQGGTWQPVGRPQPPAAKGFEYRAPRDGLYWFIIQRVDRAGVAYPADPMKAKPSMAVVVDTVPPKVKVTAERKPNGQIEARWQITETAPALPSVRLDYHTDAMPPAGEAAWTHLLPPPALEGSKEFDPGQAGRTGEVRVRVQMKDRADNVGEDVFVLPATGAPPAGAPAIGAAPRTAEGSPFSVIPAAQSDPAGQPNQLTSQPTPRPPLDPPPPAAGGPSALPAPPSRPPENHAAASASPPSFAGSMPVAAGSDRMPSPPGSPGNEPAGPATVKIVKARQVRLNFTVAKVGPSGLGAADVYVTLDRGKTWNKMPGEVPISLPPNADIHGPEPVPGSVSVQLPAEGTVYGFIVAAKSKAGLAPPPPKPGDPPEILVELDLTPPQGRLFRPQPDPSQPNTLLLGWEAKDRNLPDKPIKLEWSEQKNGPWNPIGEGALANTSQYAWRLPEHLPPRVYLRLTMTDLAGNESAAQTSEPELIDLSVPQTKLIDVAPGR